MDSHIVIIANDFSVAKPLTPALEAAGFRVSHSASFPINFKDAPPNALIVASLLPRTEGAEACRVLRSFSPTKTFPIITLIREPSPDDRVLLLEAGADDVLTDTCSARELVARVRAHIRRTELNSATDVLQGCGVKLYCKSHRVTRNGREIQLGPTEYRLLKFLMENKGQAIVRTKLAAVIWAQDAQINDRTLDVYVGRLRRAIEIRREPNPIRTIRGLGYAFDDKRES